jgi:glycosyltransferase involved in cell wall biosynthesis
MNRLMRLSIAMATWNGARYLREQLDSFRGQTRLPDEVVVCDDHSTDGTAAILDEFRRSAPFPVNVSINPERMGYVGNFEQAVRMCDGDVIFLSDQDDVWLPEKLAEHEAVYRSRPEVGMAFSDGKVVDSDLALLPLSLYEYVGATPKRLGRFAAGRGLDLFIRKPMAYGCTLSIRSDLRPLILPIPPHWIHDVWFQTAISVLAEIQPILKPLILYRRHYAQTVGVSIKGKRPTEGSQTDCQSESADAPKPDSQAVQRLKWIDHELERWEVARERLERLDSHIIRPRYRALIDAKLGYLRRRRAMSTSPLIRLPAIAGELLLGRYWLYSWSGKGDLLSDLKTLSVARDSSAT